MASPFDIAQSFKYAQNKALKTRSYRKQRSDLGHTRIAPQIIRYLSKRLEGEHFPGMKQILCDLEIYCKNNELDRPCRATIYNLILTWRGPDYRMAQLPTFVQQALYNQTIDTQIPGWQVVFYCFNYGNLSAVHYAASMPWLALYQASRSRGWHSKSLGLLRSVMRIRKIAYV